MFVPNAHPSLSVAMEFPESSDELVENRNSGLMATLSVTCHWIPMAAGKPIVRPTLPASWAAVVPGAHTSSAAAIAS
jgi:hypothetical protein